MDCIVASGIVVHAYMNFAIYLQEKMSTRETCGLRGGEISGGHD